MVLRRLVCSYGMGKCTEPKLIHQRYRKRKSKSREMKQITDERSWKYRRGWKGRRGRERVVWVDAIVYQRENRQKSCHLKRLRSVGPPPSPGVVRGREVSLPRVGQWHTHLRGEGASLKPPLPFHRPMNESPADDFFDVLPPSRHGRRVRGMITLFFCCVFIPTCFRMKS